MESDKSINKRRKSIMVIDKKGQAKEIPKEDSSMSRFIDSTNQPRVDKSNEDNKKEEDNKSNLSKEEDNQSNLSKEEDNQSNLSKEENKSNLSKEEDNQSNLSKEENNQSNLSKEENKTNLSKEENKSMNKEEEKKTLQMKNAEIAAGGATAGAACAAGIVLGKPNTKDEEDMEQENSEEDKEQKSVHEQNKENDKNNENENDKNNENDKKVVIDENKNEEHEIEADNNKSIPLTDQEKSDIKTKSPSFIPLRIPSHDLNQDSEILKEREDNNVEAEGHMWKRRRIFACFWHEKYFLLTKTGLLKYHKANGTKKSKGNWDLTKFHSIHEVFMGGDNHPFRLALMSDDENKLFGFDDSDNREYWLAKFSKFINQNNK